MCICVFVYHQYVSFRIFWSNFYSASVWQTCTYNSCYYYFGQITYSFSYYFFFLFAFINLTNLAYTFLSIYRLGIKPTLNCFQSSMRMIFHRSRNNSTWHFSLLLARPCWNLQSWYSSWHIIVIFCVTTWILKVSLEKRFFWEKYYF